MKEKRSSSPQYSMTNFTVQCVVGNLKGLTVVSREYERAEKRDNIGEQAILSPKVIFPVLRVSPKQKTRYSSAARSPMNSK